MFYRPEELQHFYDWVADLRDALVGNNIVCEKMSQGAWPQKWLA